MKRDDWAGHWIFNTNETNGPGAYVGMFKRGVAAVYGYYDGGAKLDGAHQGERVLAYVNLQGLRAVGTVVDGIVERGSGVFLEVDGQQKPREYHLKVKWEVVLPVERSLTLVEAKALGYNLPNRYTFARLHDGEAAQKLEAAMRQRSRES